MSRPVDNATWAAWVQVNPQDAYLAPEDRHLVTDTLAYQSWHLGREMRTLVDAMSTDPRFAAAVAAITAERDASRRSRRRQALWGWGFVALYAAIVVSACWVALTP